MARTPKPTNVHFLNGNPGKRARGVNEPQPPFLESELAQIARDKFLEWDKAKEWWDFLYPALRDTRLVTVIDVPELAMWCNNIASQLEAFKNKTVYSKKLTKLLASKTPPTEADLLLIASYVRERDAQALEENRAAQRAEKQVAGFGGSPAARTRIEAAKTQLDLFDEFDDLVVVPIANLHAQGKTNLPTSNAS
jgi:phage terminase small subunit